MEKRIESCIFNSMLEKLMNVANGGAIFFYRARRLTHDDVPVRHLQW